MDEAFSTGLYLSSDPLLVTDKAEKEYDQAFYGPEFVFSMNYRLPDEIGKLSELKLFHLHTNYKTRGTLAAFSNLAKLESLFLDYNKFSGDIPESFADDHPNLAYLSVAYNELKGSLPTSLARLNNLSTLIVGGNQLSGEIPSEFGIATNLGKLKELVSWFLILSSDKLCVMTELFDLQYNNFVGSIPASFYNPNLRELRLGGNDIVGSISGNISLMTELRALSLENSAMSGKLPTEIYFLPKLKELRLSNANFEGELSEDFRWLNATLMELGLGGNNFFGEIPQAFDDLKILGMCTGAPHLSHLFSILTCVFEYRKTKPWEQSSTNRINISCFMQQARYGIWKTE